MSLLLASRGTAQLALWFWVSCAIALAPVPAQAHVVFGSTTLRMLTQQSDLVARVRILEPDEILTLEEAKGRVHIVVAEILETLKGVHGEGPLRFIQQGHGVIQYVDNEEVVVFATPIAASRELSAGPVAKEIDWVSEQERGAEFRLDDSNRKDIVDAVKMYVHLETLPLDRQPDVLRRITVEMLASQHNLLSGSAIRDLVFAQDSNLIRKEELPVVLAILENPETPIGVCIGVLVELERTGLIETPARWANLLASTSGSDRLSVIRAAAAHPSEPVVLGLTKLAALDDPQIVAAAAVSLGSMRTSRVVKPLVQLLESSESRVRMAAIRGLGRVGTKDANKALEVASKKHSDPATRRRAGAELRIVQPEDRPEVQREPQPDLHPDRHHETSH